MSQMVEKEVGRRSRAVRRVARMPSVLVAALALAGLGAAISPQARAQSAEAQRHLKAAMKNSGGDFDLINHYRTFSCDAVEEPTMYDRSSPERHATRVPLTQVFDDVWYIGDMYVGQYILKTPTGGFILIDALNNSAEVDQYTMPALQSLGLGANHPLQAVILTHGHGDHDGGANRLRALFGANLEIYLGSGDAGGKAYNPVQIPSGVAEPQERTIGGIKFVFQSIPGHTPGMMNLSVPVHQDGKEYKLMMGGRQGHPGAVAAARGYLRGTERSYSLVAKYGIEGTFLTHPTSDGSTVHMQEITRTGVRNPNPFIIGQERTLRAAAIWRECAAAWLATRDATAVEPVWRVTTLTIPALKQLTNTLTAQLTTGWGRTDPDPAWGPMVGQTVTISIDRSVACTAVTNSEGVASCTIARQLLPFQKVTATYAGNSTATFVDLPSSTTSTVFPPGYPEWLQRQNR